MGTVLLTGANGGLGCRIVSQIVSASDAKYHGLYAVRNANAANSLDTTLVSKVKFDGASSHSHEKISLDLSRLSDIRRFAADINQRVADGSIPRIHAIILNAGYEEFEGQTWTGDDGLDTAFASNYLGHWLLVILLLQSMDCEVGRVLWISSWSHNPHDARNSWNGSFKEPRYNTIFNSNSIDGIAKGTWSAIKMTRLDGLRDTDDMVRQNFVALL